MPRRGFEDWRFTGAPAPLARDNIFPTIPLVCNPTLQAEALDLYTGRDTKIRNLLFFLKIGQLLIGDLAASRLYLAACTHQTSNEVTGHFYYHK